MHDAYPADRPKFFPMRVNRAMTNSCAAQLIGSAGCFLVLKIAMKEDELFYRRAVTWCDEYLMEQLNITSRKTLALVRKKCIDAGWLHYEPGCKGRLSRYWVTIPDQFDGLDVKSASEEADDETEQAGAFGSKIYHQLGDESANNRQTIGTESANNRHRTGTEKGALITLSLNPIPSPSPIPTAGEHENETPPRQPDRMARSAVNEFVALWNELPTGNRGVAHVLGLPPWPCPLDVAAIERFWASRKGVAVQAMDAIKSGAIQWERNAMTIRQFENEIDNILGGVHRRHQKPDPQAAAFKQMMDDLGDYAFQETQTVTIPSTATRRLS